jgi:hypothetical protein
MKEIIREEKILSTLNCPYILKYNESFLHNEQMCIVTEYCEVFLSLLLSIITAKIMILSRNRSQVIVTLSSITVNRSLAVRDGNITMMNGG